MTGTFFFLAFSALAVVFGTDPRPRARLAGCLAALICQPVWLSSTWGEPHLFTASCLFTAAWARGAWLSWKEFRGCR